MTGAFGADDVATLPRLMFRKLRFLMIADTTRRQRSASSSAISRHVVFVAVTDRDLLRQRYRIQTGRPVAVFPSYEEGVRNGPEQSRARRCCAAKRTLDGEDRSG